MVPWAFGFRVKRECGAICPVMGYFKDQSRDYVRNCKWKAGSQATGKPGRQSISI